MRTSLAPGGPTWWVWLGLAAIYLASSELSKRIVGPIGMTGPPIHSLRHDGGSGRHGEAHSGPCHPGPEFEDASTSMPVRKHVSLPAVSSPVMQKGARHTCPCKSELQLPTAQLGDTDSVGNRTGQRSRRRTCRRIGSRAAAEIRAQPGSTPIPATTAPSDEATIKLGSPRRRNPAPPEPVRIRDFGRWASSRGRACRIAGLKGRSRRARQSS
jgi:hypothetical protein